MQPGAQNYNRTRIPFATWRSVIYRSILATLLSDVARMIIFLIRRAFVQLGHPGMPGSSAIRELDPSARGAKKIKSYGFMLAPSIRMHRRFIMHVADNFGLETSVPMNVQGPSRDLVRRAPSENVPLLRSAVKTLPRKMSRKRPRNGRFVRKQSEKACHPRDTFMRETRR